MKLTPTRGSGVVRVSNYLFCWFYSAWKYIKSHVPDKDSFFTFKSYKKGFSKNIENGGRGRVFKKGPKVSRIVWLAPLTSRSISWKNICHFNFSFDRTIKLCDISRKNYQMIFIAFLDMMTSWVCPISKQNLNDAKMFAMHKRLKVIVLFMFAKYLKIIIFGQAFDSFFALFPHFWY